MNQRPEVVVVSHTHWDREWYRPFQVFRNLLVDVIDQVINLLQRDPTYGPFHLDGHTVLVDDYLEVRPDREAVLRELIEAGRLLIGPWYVLPDEFLVDGESLIRNLLVGRRDAQSYGGIMRVGYLPDMFAQIAQMPQLLAGFDLEGAVVWRGLEYGRSRHNEFLWEAPDGTQMLAIHLPPRGYGGLATLADDVDTAEALVRKHLEFLAPRSATGLVLLTNGDDHMPPEPGLPKALAALRERLDVDSIGQGSLEDYIRRVKERSLNSDLAVVRGECTSSRDTRILQSTFSSRMPIKQWNRRCETLLLRWAEPASAWLASLGIPSPPGLLETAWRWLLKNHPHDSICGCSVDEVHRDMMTRFAWCEQMAEELVSDRFAAWAAAINTEALGADGEVGIVVLNPTDGTGPAVVEDDVVVPAGLLPPDPAFVTPEGERVAGQVLEIGPAHRTEPERRRRGLGVDPIRARLRLLVPAMPAFGYLALRCTPTDAHPTEPFAQVMATERQIENALARIAIADDGTVDLLDKVTGQTFEGLLRFIDDADRGDEYTFQPLDPPSERVWRPERIEVVKSGPLRATIRLSGPFSLPAELAPQRDRRSEEAIDCPLTVDLSLAAVSRRVSVRVSFDNRCEDHRLRVAFPTQLSTTTSLADGCFGVFERPIGVPEANGWNEAPYPTNHMARFATLTDGRHGFTVLARGLPEYEAIDDEERTLALTLLRCVGSLARHDLEHRKDRAGPKFPTPEAQCLGPHVFEFAFFAYDGSWSHANLLREADAYEVPPRLVATGKHPGVLDPCGSFLRVDPEAIRVTTIKPTESGDAMVVRLFNPTNAPIQATLAPSPPAESAHELALSETPIRPLPVEGGCIGPIEIRPMGIITLGIRSEDRGE